MAPFFEGGGAAADRDRTSGTIAADRMMVPLDEVFHLDGPAPHGRGEA
jgi:hypothetical protein